MTTFKEKLEEVLNKQFSKGECTERGPALVLFAEACMLAREERQRGRDEVVDYVEAECNWIKEDVPDGNDGYFEFRGTDLEAARSPRP